MVTWVGRKGSKLAWTCIVFLLKLSWFDVHTRFSAFKGADDSQAQQGLKVVAAY